MNTRDLYIRAIGDLVEQLDTTNGAVAVASAWLYNPTSPNRPNRHMLKNAVAVSMRRITGAYMACQPDGTVAMQLSDKDQIVNDILSYSRLRKEITNDRVRISGIDWGVGQGSGERVLGAGSSPHQSR